jgi:DNA-binding response OmpR family regulator
VRVWRQTTRNCWPDTIAVGLRREAMAVDAAYDGGQALENVAVNRYDAAVLDRDMPRGVADELFFGLPEQHHERIARTQDGTWTELLASRAADSL